MEIAKNAAKLDKLKRIKTSDDISFSYNYEILNSCFGANMRGSLEHAVWDSKDGCLVWFPHLAKLENGKYVSTASNNWKNYFEDNKTVIIQMLYPNEAIDSNGKQPELEDTNTPEHTFMKIGDKDFRFVGTYLIDYNSSSPRYVVHRQLKDEIDLSIWASGHDTSYFDTSKIGKDVFKGYYIEKNFRKQSEYIEKFLRQDKELHEEEERYNEEREIISDKYGIATLNKMTDVAFEDEYLPVLRNVLNSLFEAKYEVEDLSRILGGRQEFGSSLYHLVYDKEICINDRIRNCPWGNVLASQIFTIYDKDGFEYIYTLSEKEIDKIFFSLGLTPNEADDLVSRQSTLYFWRHCDDVIFGWSVYRYYQFLCFMTDMKRKSIPYISSAKPDIRNRIIFESEKLDEEIEVSGAEEAPSSFEYNSEPRVREIEVSSSTKSGRIVPRHADRKLNALVKADFCCEIDKNHPTFKRRNSDKNYTETHHLIPLEYSMEFQYTLDTEENIVSLCSNCHNQIHYGAGADMLIKKLYHERKDLLKAAGIGTTLKGIEVDEIQLLHMYGLE